MALNEQVDRSAGAPDDLRRFEGMAAFVGEWLAPIEDMGSFASYDPSDGSTIARFSYAGRPEVDRAVEVAARSMRGKWGTMPPVERGRVLTAIAASLMRRREELARLECRDSGMPIQDARRDVTTAARLFEYYGGWCDKIVGETLPLGRGMTGFTVLEPLGVTAHIIPWNKPLAMICRSLAPALAAGNTVVAKPAELTPVSACLLAELAVEAGLPQGVFNLLLGKGKVAGEAMIQHPDVAHVTFTGSVETGRRVMQSAAVPVASVTLELGGKAPVVVLEDAELETAAKEVRKAIFTHAGQICTAGSRLVINENVADAFLDALVRETETLVVAPGATSPDFGPLISRGHCDRVAGYVEDARSRGLRILTGGRRLDSEMHRNGAFYAPTIIEVESEEDPLVQEEIFGPVLVVQRARSDGDALRIANGTSYGLAAGVFGSDMSRVMAFVRDLRAGQVFVNRWFAGGVEVPVGGKGQSGFGREKGREGLFAYLSSKSITIPVPELGSASGQN